MTSWWRPLVGGLLLPLIWLAGCQQASHADKDASTSGHTLQRWRSERETFWLETVAGPLEHPWSLAFLPNGDALITERPGRLRWWKGGQLQAEPLPGVPTVLVQRQAGLFDVVLHPKFTENRWVYLSYAKPGDRGSTTAVARGRWTGQGLEQVTEIFEADAWHLNSHHYGGRLAFDRDGFLYLTVGDRGAMQEAQNTKNHIGCTLRLRDDGSAPPDNPVQTHPDWRAEIWSYGHRNPQGMAFHPETGELWQNEHGPRGGDELNRIRRGANYGWPLVTHGIDYTGAVISERSEMDGVEPPRLTWTPSIACSGLLFFQGDGFPNWDGHAFVGALAQSHLRRIELDANGSPQHQEVLLDSRSDRLRTVMQGPEGWIYLLVDSPQGQMLRLRPEHAQAPPAATPAEPDRSTTGR